MGKKNSSFFGKVLDFLSFAGNAFKGIFGKKNHKQKTTEGLAAPKNFQTSLAKLRHTKDHTGGFGKPCRKLEKKFARQAKSNLGPIKAHYRGLEYLSKNGELGYDLQIAHQGWINRREKLARQRMIDGRPLTKIKNGKLQFC